MGTGMEELLGDCLKILTWNNWGLILHSPDLQGVTFRVEGGELVIARILHGGMVAQQGLLHMGDIIKEVNGQLVGSDPRALQELLCNASGCVILKILPSYQEPHLPCQVGPSTNPTPSTRPKGWLSLLPVRVAGLTEDLLSYWFPPGEIGGRTCSQGAADHSHGQASAFAAPAYASTLVRIMHTATARGTRVYERAPASWSAFFTCLCACAGWGCHMSWTAISWLVSSGGLAPLSTSPIGILTFPQNPSPRGEGEWREGSRIRFQSPIPYLLFPHPWS